MAVISGGTHLLDAKELLKHQLDLHEGDLYADLGIGSSAHFIFPAAKIVQEEGKVYAVDILKPVLEVAQSKARTEGVSSIIEIVWTDLEVYGAAKQIKNNSLNALSLINILYQTTEDEHVFNEANRMLDEGGKALVIDWLPEEGSFGPPKEERTSLEEVRRLAKIVGWREVRAFSPGPYHFGVVFEK